VVDQKFPSVAGIEQKRAREPDRGPEDREGMINKLTCVDGP
jgi:hypothetical protein